MKQLALPLIVAAVAAMSAMNVQAASIPSSATDVLGASLRVTPSQQSGHLATPRDLPLLARAERAERVERVERVEKAERPERVERPEKPEAPEKIEKPQKPEKSK